MKAQIKINFHTDITHKPFPFDITSLNPSLIYFNDFYVYFSCVKIVGICGEHVSLLLNTEAPFRKKLIVLKIK